MRKYKEAKLIWGKLTYLDDVRVVSKADLCDGVEEEVAKMEKRGKTYLGDFAQFDGHRHAMDAWRSKTKMGKKLGTEEGANRETGEFPRAAQGYQRKIESSHALCG